jgi:hemerythrin-like metal-binding protein
MALKKWSSRYSVGVRILDEQHKIFVGIFNELHAAMMKGQAQGIATSLFRKLKEQVIEHHSTEEKLMEAAGYPKLTQHREHHRTLIETFESFSARHENGDHKVYVPLLYAFRDWHDCHLLQHDREYIPHLAEKEFHREAQHGSRELT